MKRSIKLKEIEFLAKKAPDLSVGSDYIAFHSRKSLRIALKNVCGLLVSHLKNKWWMKKIECSFYNKTSFYVTPHISTRIRKTKSVNRNKTSIIRKHTFPTFL